MLNDQAGDNDTTPSTSGEWRSPCSPGRSSLTLPPGEGAGLETHTLFGRTAHTDTGLTKHRSSLGGSKRATVGCGLHPGGSSSALPCKRKRRFLRSLAPNSHSEISFISFSTTPKDPEGRLTCSDSVDRKARSALPMGSAQRDEDARRGSTERAASPCDIPVRRALLSNIQCLPLIDEATSLLPSALFARCINGGNFPAPISWRFSPTAAQAVEGLAATPIGGVRHTPDDMDPDPSAPPVTPPSPRRFSLHASIFYPCGTEAQPPILLHYLALSGWRTIAGGRDYFRHRRLHPGEVRGHVVHWLHNAYPRDRFVFVVDPVEVHDKHETLGWWQRQKQRIFGAAPAFAHRKRQLLQQRVPSFDEEGGHLGRSETSSRLSASRGAGDSSLAWTLSQTSRFGSTHSSVIPSTFGGRCRSAHRATTTSAPSLANRPSYRGVTQSPTCHQSSPQLWRRGVAVVEIRHSDITALDYAPRLTSTRLSMEVKAVHTYFLSSMEEVLQYYHYPEEELRTVTDLVSSPSHARSAHGDSMFPEAVHSYEWSGPLVGLQASRTMELSIPARSGEGHIVPRREQAPVGCPVVDALDDLSLLVRGPMKNTAVPPEGDACGNSQGSSPTASLHRTGYLPRDVDTTLLRHPPWRRMTHTPPLSKESIEGAASPTDTAFVFAQVLRSSDIHPELISSHTDTIVSINTEDPHFNAVLREVLMPEPGTHPYCASEKEQRRMLSMYEAGMPAWTVLVVSTGLLYRRIFRLVYVHIINVWPIVSLAVGLYDLYKHFPQLKRFMAYTLEPVARWLEKHFMLRVSVLTTYLISSVLTVFTSLRAFFSQFYVVQLLSLSVVQLLFSAVRLPFVIAFETLLSVWRIAVSFVRLVTMTVKLLLLGPFLLVSQLSNLQLGASVLPTAMEGTSLTLRWLSAWQEFWVTVAAPIKNLAKAWWDYVMHVVGLAVRREASIRHGCTPTVTYALDHLAHAHSIAAMNLHLWSELLYPGYGLQVLLLLCIIYLYWITMVLSPDIVIAAAREATTMVQELTTQQISYMVSRLWPSESREHGLQDGSLPVAALCDYLPWETMTVGCHHLIKWSEEHNILRVEEGLVRDTTGCCTVESTEIEPEDSLPPTPLVVTVRHVIDYYLIPYGETEATRYLTQCGIPGTTSYVAFDDRRGGDRSTMTLSKVLH